MATPAKPRTKSTRAGAYRAQPAGFAAFHPAAYPPADLDLGPALLGPLERANLELGKLIGAAEILPNPDLFVRMYVRREAVLSSQIEGTQASLMDLLEWEASRARAERTVDVKEVSNYLHALRYGLRRVPSLPVSLRLIREIHGRLMRGARGGEPQKTPGEFRRSQNWVGGPSPATARYVPPPVPAMHDALGEFERSLHEQPRYPVLVNVGLEPLLYLSVFFKQHRDEYYGRLQAIRDAGDWEGWLAFFLEGIGHVAAEATSTARTIVNLRETLRATVATSLGRRSRSALRLLDRLFRTPVVTVKSVQKMTELSQPAAAALVTVMQAAGVLREITGHQRNRVFAFDQYLALFQERRDRE